MGKVIKAMPVKLVIGFIFGEDLFYDNARISLERKFGKIDFESQALDFIYTDYYEKEMGQGLKRRFVSFSKLIFPSNLAGIKNLTYNIESKLALKNRRRINIDPGYLDMAKLVLASTKNYAHRIYLDKGVYAEITLRYQDNSFQPWEWTYPDYRTQEYIEIFHSIRKIYSQQITK